MNEDVFEAEAFGVAEWSTSICALIELLIKERFTVVSITFVSSSLLAHQLTHIKVALVESHGEWRLTEQVQALLFDLSSCEQESNNFGFTLHGC